MNEPWASGLSHRLIDLEVKFGVTPDPRGALENRLQACENAAGLTDALSNSKAGLEHRLSLLEATSACSGPVGFETVFGTVFDPTASFVIPGAAVFLCSAGKCYTQITNVNGQFSIGGVQSDTYSVRVGRSDVGFKSTFVVAFGFTDAGFMVLDQPYQDPKCP